MQDNMEKNDLRVVKTAKVLNEAMFYLLTRNDFRKITVRDICDEAQISRATFYARFADKYDFLKSWLINFKPEKLSRDSTYEETEKILNDYINKNRTIIKNLISGADNETLEILAEFMLSVLNLTDKYDLERMTPEQIVLSDFFAGGMIFYFKRQVKNKFPPDITPINICLYQVIETFREWMVEAL